MNERYRTVLEDSAFAAGSGILAVWCQLNGWGLPAFVFACLGLLYAGLGGWVFWGLVKAEPGMYRELSRMASETEPIGVSSPTEEDAG